MQSESVERCEIIVEEKKLTKLNITKEFNEKALLKSEFFRKIKLLGGEYYKFNGKISKMKVFNCSLIKFIIYAKLSVFLIIDYFMEKKRHNYIIIR